MIAGINLYRIMAISPVFDILIFCSALAMAVGLERFWTYRFLNLEAISFMDRIKAMLSKKQYDEAIKICEGENKPLANMVRVGLVNINRSSKNISKLMDARKLIEREKAERFLSILGTLGNSAPFIGLLGTVIGIIRAFKLLETTGATGPTAIMIGIAEALVTTAMGLFVAIPCVMMFNWFTDRIKNFFIEMEIASKELLTMIPKKPMITTITTKKAKATTKTKVIRKSASGGSKKAK